VKASWTGPEPVAAEGASARRPDKLHGERLDRAEVSSEPERYRGLGLDLASTARHRLRYAADERHAAAFLSHRRDQGLSRAEEVGGGEQHRQ